MSLQAKMLDMTNPKASQALGSAVKKTEDKKKEREEQLKEMKHGQSK